MRFQILLFILLFSFSAQNFADKIHGKLSFEKGAPFAGVAYIHDDDKRIQSAEMDQLDKSFTKKILVTSNGSNTIFKNSDSFEHNIFANDLTNKVSFDVGLIAPGEQVSIEVDWYDASLIRLGCKIHPRMRAYIANITSEDYQVIEFERGIREYQFSFENVDPSRKSFRLLMPKYDPVIIPAIAGESKTVDIVRKGRVKGQLVLSRE